MAETTKRAAEWLIHSMSNDDLAALALELDGGSIDEFTDVLNAHLLKVKPELFGEPTGLPKEKK